MHYFRCRKCRKGPCTALRDLSYEGPPTSCDWSEVPEWQEIDKAIYIMDSEPKKARRDR